jgi:DNA polymerase III epsilon subunit family exonuclease
MFGRKKSTEVDMEQLQYVVIDTETTGLKSDTGRIIEIAVIQIDALGNRSEAFHTLIDPGKKFTNSDVHGIKPSDVKNAPKFDDISHYVADLMKGRIVVGHNIEFDFDFLCSEYRRLGVTIPSIPRIDTMKMCFDLGLPLANQQLSTILAFFDLPAGLAHSALHDAAATSSIFSSMLQLYGIRNADMRAFTGQLGSEHNSWMPKSIVEPKFDALPRTGIDLSSIHSFPTVADDQKLNGLARSKAEARTAARQEPPCPKCGRGVVVVKNRRDGGKFRGCSNFPNCRYAIDY